MKNKKIDWGVYMLNFEEELKKFKPSLEVEHLEEALYEEDLSDMMEVLKRMMEQDTKQKR